MTRVLVTGGTGFIGNVVVRALLARGDEVTVLTRNPKRGRQQAPRGARVVGWTPKTGGPWEAELGVVDAVVHLAGAPVAKRWSKGYRDVIVDSRVETGTALVTAIAKNENKPRVLVSASGTGFYGAHHPGRVLVEGDGEGSDFLAQVCVKWEAAARAAEDHGVRTVQLRIGAVIGAGGGVIDGMVQLGGSFVGGPIGKGDNIVSWVHVDDVAGICLMAIDDPSLSGPVNTTSPHAVTQKELAQSIGRVLGRPAVPAPRAVVEVILGEVTEAVCGSLDVQPKRVMEAGYAFHHARLMAAIEAAVGPADS